MPLFPATFWSLALAHAVALVSPGPDTILVVSHSVRHRLAGSAYICVGIAAGNAVYIALAIVGWAGMREYPLLYRAVELAGAAYLVWLSIRLIKTGKSRWQNQSFMKPGAEIVFPSLGSVSVQPFSTRKTWSFT